MIGLRSFLTTEAALSKSMQIYLTEKGLIENYLQWCKDNPDLEERMGLK